MSLSEIISCGVCGNISKMKILSTVYEGHTEVNVRNVVIGEWGNYYSVLKCPECEKINFVSYEWDDANGTGDKICYEILYPQNVSYPKGLPENILKALKKAEKVKSIDADAYAILIRVC